VKTSAKGLALIEAFEALRLRAYQDGNGVWTIGYGHTGPEVRFGTFETKEKAEADLCADVGEAEAAVRQLVRVPLTQGQWDALVSFAYNEGRGRLATSTVLKLLNAGCYQLAASHFRDWEVVSGKHSDGLARRREAEIALFLEAA
jgi:lysozyme